MAIKPLDKQTADAVCTVIAVGFMADQSPKKDKEYLCTKFQYELTDDPQENTEILNEHERLHKLLNTKTDLRVSFTPAESQYNFPFILAKPPLEEGVQELGSVITAYNNTKAFWEKLEILAHQEGVRPYGAYIGGYAHSFGFALTGPSLLKEYCPTFREVTDGWQTDFNKFQAEIEKAHKAVKAAKECAGNAGVGGINYDEILRSEDQYHGGLVGCVHGMVHAMLKYPNPIAPNSVHMEYSLAPKTTKVASCIPCSIFMSANSRPASSTHLGRGDNWNFPSPSKQYPNMTKQYDNWEEKVVACYQKGKTVLANAFKCNEKLKPLITIERKDNIPLLFLESLTFQDSFAKRIMNTLM